MGESIEKQTSIMNKYFDIFIEKLPSIIVAIITVIIGVLIAKMVKKIMHRVLNKYRTSIGVVSFLINFVQVLIIVFAVMQAFSLMGFNTTSLAAILGAAGFSIGLAFKEVLSNFGSCLIILFFKPFQIGDYISCNEIEGTVSEIQMFSTSLKTVDNKLIVMPNFQITSNPLINYTAQDKRRIDFVFRFEYDTDVKLLYDIAKKIFEEDDRIIKNPQPLIGIDSMENNSITFVAKPWTKTDDYWDAYYDIMEKFKNEFDTNEIKLSNVALINTIK
ncbi:mechanosensitive ion channel family protein [Peptostreptococcus faecalis]|uniref:mechanosensitive ion channel family protein n=1 Tax=Peptostreptococcus faecalis TaxID=2045015 RepID=UPI000C7A80BC|nr:mechanosensitive ion channel domain-containing protein [Peptostreptococcus faecalis]